MLCCRTYKEIAGAVRKNPILRKYTQQLYLEEVDCECTAMCSLKNPSCLRLPSKKDLQRFSLKKFNSELESKATLFSVVLWTASERKSKRDEFWLPSECMSAAVLLKNRSPCMNAMQLINIIILYHSGITVSIFLISFYQMFSWHSICPNLLKRIDDNDNEELIPKLQSSLPSIQLYIFHLIINGSDGESHLNSLLF